MCRAASRDSGKPLVDSAFGEIFTTCEKISWLLKEGQRYLRPEIRSPPNPKFYWFIWRLLAVAFNNPTSTSNTCPPNCQPKALLIYLQAACSCIFVGAGSIPPYHHSCFLVCHRTRFAFLTWCLSAILSLCRFASFLCLPPIPPFSFSHSPSLSILPFSHPLSLPLSLFLILPLLHLKNPNFKNLQTLSDPQPPISTQNPDTLTPQHPNTLKP